MKRRHLEPELDAERAQRLLCEALLSLRSVAEMRAFLDDLCTPAEREAMGDRWSVVPHLLALQYLGHQGGNPHVAGVECQIDLAITVFLGSSAYGTSASSYQNNSDQIFHAEEAAVTAAHAAASRRHGATCRR